MARATTAGRAVHGGKLVPAMCIALSGKGAPGTGGLEVAIDAVTRTAKALHDATRRRGHEWKPGDPEVALRRPAGVRGGVGFTVRLAVPAFVTARDVHEASAEAARKIEIAKNIRLARVEEAEKAAAGNGRVGRDHQPAGIRRVRAGAPQHRARDLR
jgi:hypothetical protein